MYQAEQYSFNNYGNYQISYEYQQNMFGFNQVNYRKYG